MASPHAEDWPRLKRPSHGRVRGNFLTRTATDDAAQLMRRSSVSGISPSYQTFEHTRSHTGVQSTDPRTAETVDISQDDSHSYPRPNPASTSIRGSKGRSASENRPLRSSSGLNKNVVLTKGETLLRPVGGSHKLGTYAGVFVPTSLNVLSILMFIRFGFILGQAGLIGTIIMLLTAYVINLFTTLSISAVASNGTVRGGGAYYLISRSLGPEFGGSIGIVSYLGFVFNTGMNAVGLVDCLSYNFGSDSGIWANWLPEGGWWQYLWSTIVVVLCVAICLAGSAIFARASNGLLVILMVAIISIPFSAIFRLPFKSPAGLTQYTDFTGLSLDTLKQNLFPKLTRGAAGSQLKRREDYQDLFGILFPATGGIFAGASMSGDLKSPSRSIPRGTLYSILLTFATYAIVIIAMASTITRRTFYENVNVVQDVNLSGILVLVGEVATTFFSVLMGIVGPAMQLQAISRDGIFPGLKWFAWGTSKTDNPIIAILLTWVVAQITILFDINSIASLVTMAYLMMSFGLHIACLLLKISSAPNFRPSFKFFNQWTAFAGALLSVASMFFVDPKAAMTCIALLVFIFLVVHYTTPPKSWGADVTSGLVYHQVRKYLLRLKTEHVKYWRPQILLFVNDPRRGYKLISFANSLKKGGLFILGHVIVTDNFGASVPEARRQQAAWTRFIDHMKIKSFVNVAISPSIEWGARNIVLSAGLGGMRPNIVMMGFYNLAQFRQEQPLVDIPSPPPERKHATKRKRSLGEMHGDLPTDTCYVEKRTDIQSYVLTLEDMILKLKTNVAVAVNFGDLELPHSKGRPSRKYIDLWPIQMSAEISYDEHDPQQSITTTNFDTYTLILQLGCILNTVPSWKRFYTLRVAVFVEYESDVDEERHRVKALLESLRIKAEVLVFWLASGDIKSYNLVVNGETVDEESDAQINKVLEDEHWWRELRQTRGYIRSGDVSTVDALSLADDVLSLAPDSLPRGRENSILRADAIRRILQAPRPRASFGNLSRLGVNLNMRSHRLDDDLISRHVSLGTDSEYTSSQSDPDTDIECDSEGSDGINEHYIHSDVGSEPKSLENINRPVSSHTQESEGKKATTSSGKSSKASSRKSKASSKRHNRALRESVIKNYFTSRDEPSATEPGAADRDEVSRGRIPYRESDDASLKSTSRTRNSGDGSKHSRAASPQFTSKPFPVTKVASTEDQGPSIMFAEEPHPRHLKSSPGAGDGRSIYQRLSDEARCRGSKPADGFPSTAAIPLSFNDLPCRAQHLILNELISQNCDETVVIFTTLPSPSEGTFRSEANSLTYITDLEVLTQGLGPTLLVHSNSMTVTTNL